MNFSYKLPAILVGGAISISVAPQIVTALSPTEVNAIAKEIMVRIDGEAPGTGVIVARQGNTYTVLTNWHVVDKTGAYTIQTVDGKTYKAEQIKRLGKVDLAVAQFSSDRSYRIAELGDSSQIVPGTSVYAAGWIAPDKTCFQRCDNYTSGQLNRKAPDAKNGYSWNYSNQIKPGMSGGPVLDPDGRLVGINGQSIVDGPTNQREYFAIPIDTYYRLTKISRTPTPPRATLPSSPPNARKPPTRTAILPTTTSCVSLLNNKISIPSNISCSYVHQNKIANTIESQQILVLNKIENIANPMQNAIKRENQLGLVEPGTKIKIIGETITPVLFLNFTKVEILQGRLQGKTGWVATSAIVLR